MKKYNYYFLFFFVFIKVNSFASEPFEKSVINSSSLFDKGDILSLLKDTCKHDSVKLSISQRIDSIKSPIVLNYNILNYPLSKESFGLYGTSGLITSPSMSQSLNITTSFHNLAREGLYRLYLKSNKSKKVYQISSSVLDLILYLPIPLSSGWLHEEFHRSIMLKNGFQSYNDINKFPITQTFINVSNVRDEDLILLKKKHPQDMIRMSIAGIEGEYMLVNNINQSQFLHNSNSYTLTPLLSTLNSVFYVLACSDQELSENIEYSESEWNNISKRDIVGLDFLAWTYDLYNPFEAYEARGIHPSGNGIDRYITYNDFSEDGKRYLKKQGYLQLLNFINPMTWGINSFDIKGSVFGSDTRGNFYVNHILSPFGYDMSLTSLFSIHNKTYIFAIHNYINYSNWTPGVEASFFDIELNQNFSRNTFKISATINTWLQPENQLFLDIKSMLGASIQTNAYYSIGAHWQPYISLTAKSKGWIMGNEFLDKNISFSVGTRTFF